MHCATQFFNRRLIQRLGKCTAGDEVNTPSAYPGNGRWAANLGRGHHNLAGFGTAGSANSRHTTAPIIPKPNPTAPVIQQTTLTEDIVIPYVRPTGCYPPSGWRNTEWDDYRWARGRPARLRAPWWSRQRERRGWRGSSASTTQSQTRQEAPGHRSQAVAHPAHRAAGHRCARQVGGLLRAERDRALIRVPATLFQPGAEIAC